MSGVWHLYIIQVLQLLRTRRVHARAVSVLLRIWIPILLCVHPVFAKYDDDTYTASVDIIQVRYHTRLAVCTCCACFAEIMTRMY